VLLAKLVGWHRRGGSRSRGWVFGIYGAWDSSFETRRPIRDRTPTHRMDRFPSLSGRPPPPSESKGNGAAALVIPDPRRSFEGRPAKPI